MSDSKNSNPYSPPAHPSEASSDQRSASVLWTIPGGALGVIIGACLIRRPDELFRDHNVLVMVALLVMWGCIGLVGSMIWRVPRYLIWGPIQTDWIGRFVSGAMLFISCVVVLQMGRTRVIDLPEPAMGITMISMLLACVIGCVQLEVWLGRRNW